jgi:aspartyl-tRNA(Asn)/glutamyl-tRNA(Gln) amidotransferase subunit B
VEVDDAWLEKLRGAVGEQPLQRQGRMQREYSLSEADAATILSDRATADLFESAAMGGHAPTLAKQFISFWAAKANARNVTVGGLGIPAASMGELSRMTAEGIVNSTAAAAIADRMLEGPKTIEISVEQDISFSAMAIAQRDGLIQVRDEGQMKAWVEEAFAANAKAVQDAIANPKKQQQARGFLTGQVMKISGGKADPKIIGRLIEEKLTR